jgi:hypothetical protein
VPAAVSASIFITIVDHQLGYGYVLDPQEMVAHRYDLNAAGPSYVAHLHAEANGGALLSADPKPDAESTANSTAAAQTSHWRLRAFPPHKDRAPAGTPVAMSTGSRSSSLGSGFPPEDSGFASAPTMRIDQPFLAAPNSVRTENLGEQMILGFRARGTRVVTTLPAGQIGNDRPIDIVSEQWFSPELELVMRNMHHDPWIGEFTTTIVRVSRGDQPVSLFEVPAPYRIIDAASEGEHHVLDGRGNHASGPAPW